MCKIFKVSSSGFYKWRKNQHPKHLKNKELDRLVRYEFEKSRGTYGAPRIALALRKSGVNYSCSTIARTMRRLFLVARRKRRFKVTTDSNHDYLVKPNLLNREFEVEELATAWVSDITYIKVNQDWAYLTTVIDLADRMVIGWSISKSMTAKSTVVQAFLNAVSRRKPRKGFIFHSDRGVQYACKEFTQLLEVFHARQSMSRKGDCWDNAVAESFFKTIKIESLYHLKINSIQHAKSIIFNYIDGWYNTVRIHTSLGGKSPLEMSKIKTNYLYAA